MLPASGVTTLSATGAGSPSPFFTIWRPDTGVLASILYGGLYILSINNILPTGGAGAVKELYKMLPYVMTIIVLVLTSVRNKKENQPPAALGLSYFREER